MSNLFDQVDKITFFISYCEDIAQVGTTLFGGDFSPKNHFGHVRQNTCRLVFRVLKSDPIRASRSFFRDLLDF